MKKISVIVGLLCLAGGRAYAGAFEDQARQVGEEITTEVNDAKAKIAASQVEHAAADKAAAEKAASLQCYPLYSVDYRKERNSAGIFYWMAPTSKDLDAGVSFDGGFFPNFSVDLAQFDRVEQNKTGSSGRGVSLTGNADDAKILPVVDVYVNPYYRREIQAGNFEGFTLTISQVKKSKEDVPAGERIGSSPYDGIYVRSTQIRVNAVKGVDFKVTLDSLVDGVRSIEFDCRLR